MDITNEYTFICPVRMKAMPLYVASSIQMSEMTPIAIEFFSLVARIRKITGISNANPRRRVRDGISKIQSCQGILIPVRYKNI